jgi:hypothetical protein
MVSADLQKGHNMSSNFDIKAIRKIGADLIKVHGLGGEFKSDDIGTLASAHSGEITASQSYEYRITELNDKPENWFTPSQEGSTNDKVSWGIKRKTAMVICLSVQEVTRMVETEGTTNDAEKLFRKQMSDKISDKLKNIRRGMINADRRLNPEKYQRAVTKRDAQDRIMEHVTAIAKILSEIGEDDNSIWDIPETSIALKTLEKQVKRKS